MRTSEEGGSRPAKPAATTQRLAKAIAQSGLCSRREAEQWIAAGRVTVNGEIIQTPAYNVSDSDSVSVDNEPLVERQGTRLWLYHKPAGLVVTERDPQGRPDVFEAVAKHGLPRVVSVGRLDINTEGLLLLTNDGGLKRVLELPATGWLRRYRVRAHGAVTQDILDGLKDGITLDKISYGPIEAKLEREQGANVWLDVALREGKNREIKKVLMHLGLEVNRLIRVSFGPFQLGDIPKGAVVTVRGRVLRDQLGKRLADEAGVRFVREDPSAEVQPGPKPVKRVLNPNKRMGDGPKVVKPGRKASVPRGRTGAPRPGIAAGQRPDRPGLARGRRAGATDDRNAEEPMGRIIFDDGREPETFIKRAKSARAGFGARAGGAARPERAGDSKGRDNRGRDSKGRESKERDGKQGQRLDKDAKPHLNDKKFGKSSFRGAQPSSGKSSRAPAGQSGPGRAGADKGKPRSR